MKKIVLLTLGILFLPLLVSAANFQHGESVSLPSGQELQDNFYGAGTNVSITAPVIGDVIIAGQTLTISEKVTDDVWAAGESISILKEVTGDVRAVGQTILINGAVSRDVLIAGQNITLMPSATVGSDLLIAGETITIGGPVKGDAKIYGKNISINSVIDGNVIVETDKTLTFGANAQIKGSLTYSAPKEITIPAGVVGGATVYQKTTHKENNDKGWLAGAALGFISIKFLIILLAAFFLFRLVPALVLETTTQALNSPGREFVRGLILVIVMPIVAILFLVTIIGALIGGFVGSAFLVLILLAKGMAGIFFGALLLRLMHRHELIIINWKSVLLGVFALQLLYLIPIIGWAAQAVIVLVTLGSLALVLYRRMTSLQ